MPVMSLPFTRTTVVSSTASTYTLAGPLGTVQLKAHRADVLLDAPLHIEVWVHCRRGAGPATGYCSLLDGPCWTDVLTGRATELYRPLLEPEGTNNEEAIYDLLTLEYYRSCEQEMRR